MTPAFSDTSSSFSWEPEHARVSQSGDLGYTIGRYRTTRIGTDGVEVVATGSYVSIWRKQADGSPAQSCTLTVPTDPGCGAIVDEGFLEEITQDKLEIRAQ